MVTSNSTFLGMDKFADILASSRVCASIFSQALPVSIIRFSRCSKQARKAVSEYSMRAYDINKLLAWFFLDVNVFCSLQAQTAALISGSIALQFFDRVYYPESDLDLYVYGRANLHILGCWILKQGYEFIPNRRQSASFDQAALRGCITLPPTLSPTANMDLVRVRHDVCHNSSYDFAEIKGVFTFTKAPEHRYRSPSKVQIIEAENCALACVLKFHSTGVMNFISYEAAYSLYPLATFELRRFLAMGNVSRRRAQGLIKYTFRGFRIVSNVFPTTEEPRQAEKPFYPGIMRWVDDCRTWIIPLTPTNVSPPGPLSPTSDPLTQDPIVHNSWALHRKGADRKMRMMYSVVGGVSLAFNYTVQDKVFIATLVDFLNDQGKLGLAKRDYSERALAGIQIIVGTNHGLMHMDSRLWTWWYTELGRLKAGFLSSAISG